jgi:murein DD-endopeptidase MepM/ murein hydrolase activator NlpD
MFALPSARLSGIRRIVTGGSLLIVLAAALPSAPAFAEPSSQHARVDLVRVQRPIADDVLLDQTLVATVALPAAPPAPAPVTAPAPVPEAQAQSAAAPAMAAAVDDGNDMQIAAIGGPAMLPLVPQFNALWPTHGLITTYFGEVGPYSPRGHAGIDVAGPQGTPIVAMDEGEVLKAYWNGDGYGGLVVIGHPSGYETWYGHLARFSVAPGATVRRGEPIGLMGSTGFSTGSHLHFEVRQDGQLIDPLVFLKEASLQDANR